MKRRIRKQDIARDAAVNATNWKGWFFTAVVSLVVGVGLFYAATQHFASMDLSLTNSKLRSQLDELRNERRSLELQREVALSPVSLKNAARSLGFVERDASAMLANAKTSNGPASKPDQQTNGTDRLVEIVSTSQAKDKAVLASVKETKPAGNSDRAAKQASPKAATQPDRTAKTAPTSSGDVRARVIGPKPEVRKIVISGQTAASTGKRALRKLEQ